MLHGYNHQTPSLVNGFSSMLHDVPSLPAPDGMSAVQLVTLKGPGAAA